MAERLFLIFVFLLSLGFKCATAIGVDELSLRLQNGTSNNARLIDIRPDRVTVFQKNAESTEFLFDQLLSLGSPSDQPEFDQVVFRNGSVLVTVVKSVEIERIQIESRLWSNSFVPTGLVKGIIFHPQSTETLRQIEIDSMIASKSSKLQIRLKNDDVMQAEISKNSNSKQASGVGEIFLRIGEQPSTFEIGKTRSITFTDLAIKNRASKASEFGLHELGLSDGSLLSFESITTTDDAISIQLDQGFLLNANLRIRDKTFWERVCYFRPSTKSARSLSNQKPFRIVDSTTELKWKTQLNRSVNGGRLVVGDLKTTKGIGTHAESQVIYLIEKNDAIFRCSVGIDQSASRLGDAMCRVLLLNSENRWVPYPQTFAVSAGAAAKEITIDVSGYRAIGLVSQIGKHGTVGDRVNWLDARMQSVK